MAAPILVIVSLGICVYKSTSLYLGSASCPWAYQSPQRRCTSTDPVTSLPPPSPSASIAPSKSGPLPAVHLPRYTTATGSLAQSHIGPRSGDCSFHTAASMASFISLFRSGPALPWGGIHL